MRDTAADIRFAGLLSPRRQAQVGTDIAGRGKARGIYVARDRDPAGDAAMATLIERASAAGIETVALSPWLGDFNEDLRLLGHDALVTGLRDQIAPQDVARFISLAA